MFDRRWLIPEPDASRAEALAAAAGIGPVTAAVLLRRGIGDPRAVQRFLAPKLEDLGDPGALRDMGKAAGRIAKAVREGQRIWICGDYDVDGSTGTAILMHFFRRLGLPARFHIPHRVKEGYGLQVPAVERLAAEGADVAITVDNGISAREAAVRARELGIDLIITDHHEPPETLPECFALINPRQPGCTSGFKELCGAALAFKLAWAVAQELGPGRRATSDLREFLLDALGLVALATVADVAPLEGENRVLVRYGLNALARTKLPGLLALKKRAGIDGVPTARDLAFGLGPRINAGGRLADASLCVSLLTTQDPDEAERLADELEGLNRQRREVERGVLDEAQARLSGDLPAVIALGDPGWHMGVLGIAAAKLAEQHMRPVLLAAWDPETGLGRGSGRSIPGFHLTEALAKAREHLVAYGGHAYASGFTVRRESFEPLAAALSAEVTAWAGGEVPRPLVTVDAEVALARLGEAAVQELSHLGPHGEGNPEPVLLARGLRLAGRANRMGREGAHLSFLVRQGEGKALRAIAFRHGEGQERLEALGQAFDLAFTPRLNRWKGNVSVELEAVAVRPASPG
jgi:single-stranded-DNA-specific exonuclease